MPYIYIYISYHNCCWIHFCQQTYWLLDLHFEHPALAVTVSTFTDQQESGSELFAKHATWCFVISQQASPDKKTPNLLCWLLFKNVSDSLQKEERLYSFGFFANTFKCWCWKKIHRSIIILQHAVIKQLSEGFSVCCIKRSMF